MKTQFYAILILMSIASSASWAQFDLGVMGGIHLTKNEVDPDDAFDTKARTEFGIGLLANFGIAQNFSVQVHPMYLGKGTDIEVAGFDEDVEVSTEHIEIPILGRYSFGSNMVKPYVLLGPSIGFLLSAEQTASFIPPDQEDITDDSKSVELSIGAGLGIEFDLGTVSTYIQAKYFHGLTNVDDVDTEEDFTDSIYHRGIAIMVGAAIPIVE